MNLCCSKFLELSWHVVVQCQGHLFAHSPPMGVPTGAKLYLWNRWVDFLFSNSIELSWPVVVQRQDHLPIRPLWTCPWAKTFISETAGRIFSVRSFTELFWPVSGQCQSYLPIRPPVGIPLGESLYIWNHWTDFLCSKFCRIVLTCICAMSRSFIHPPLWACPWAKNFMEIIQLLSGSHGGGVPDCCVVRNF